MKKLSILSLGLAMLTFASCSSDDQETKSISQSTPITLVSNLDLMRTANTNLQKTQIAEGVKIGVFVKGTNGYIEDGDNAEMTADGSGNFTGNTLYFPEDGSNVSVNAYAPYNAAFTSKMDEAVDFSIATDQSTDANYLASDLLCGAPAGENAYNMTTPAVPLVFKHMLSKLNIKFTFSGETDVDLKGASVSILNTKPSTTLKVSDATLGVASGTATDIKAVTFAADATAFVASAIIVPQTVGADDFIQISLTDGRTLRAPLKSETSFLSGKAYTYTVKILGEGAQAAIEIEMSTEVTDWDSNTTALEGDAELVENGGSDEPDEPGETTKLYATFQTPASNASYNAPTYTWTGSTSNLMTIFEFNNGELKNFSKLVFTFSNLVDGPVRMGYYVGSTFTEFGNGYYSAGTKEVDLTALGIDLSTVTKIAFGGRSNAGSCDILASDVYLEGTGSGSGEGSGSGDDNTLTATFGTPGSNATYNAPTYTWTGSTSNLMTVFEFANGELANYSKLTFTFSNLVDGPVRMGYYVGSTFTEFGNGFYSAGTKEVDLTALGIDLSTVTKIAFGGRSNAGSCDILAKDVILSK
ncbi:MAG: fimbrillin family protein [Prevotella sp.]|nr:fimbrillin family protein [Prevotella sp.]